MDEMSRRQILRSTMTLASGVGAMVGGVACAGSAGAQPASAASTTSATSAARGRRHAGPYLETGDGAQLFHLDWGTGKPVVFTHAWSLNADLWEYPMAELSEHGLRCVAYDRRGHGRSSDPGRGYDFDSLADDLAMVLDRLDLREVTLVGHSMGGGEIARYLARHGAARIAKTVLVSSVTPVVAKLPDNADGADPAVYDTIVASLKADRPAAVTAGVPLFTGPEGALSPAMVQWLTTQFLRASLKGTIECMRAVGSSDFRRDLRAFTMPTLIVHGDADMLNPLDKTGRRTAQAIRGSELKVYEGAPHGVTLTHKERFTRDLFAFVQR